MPLCSRLLLLCLPLAACDAGTRGWVLAEHDAGCAACAEPELELVGETQTPIRGNDDSGSEHTDLCPDNQVVIGYLGSVGDISANDDPVEVATSLRAVCGTPRVSAPGAIEIVRAKTLVQRGQTGGIDTWSQMCPSDTAVIGITGRAGVALDSLGLTCAPLSLGPTDALDATAFDPQGGEGGSAFQDACPQGEVARGHRLRSGVWIDAFSLICGALSTWRPDIARAPLATRLPNHPASRTRWWPAPLRRCLQRRS